MVICEKCGTENLDGSQYCDECGASLARGERAASGNHGTDRTGAPTGSAKLAEAISSSGARHEVASLPVSSQALRAVSSRASSSSLPNEPHAKLIIQRGRSAGKEFFLSDDETQIGRWDADGGVFPDVDLDSDDPEAKVSRRHARIARRDDDYFIEDLGSTNGTFINRGRRLLPGDRQTLRDGDEIIVGKTFLRFHVMK